MVFKELSLNSFCFGLAVVVFKETDLLTVSSLGRSGGLQRTDF